MRGLRIIVVLLLVLLAWLQYRLWFGNGGQREVAALRAQVQRQAHDNAGLRQRNEALAAEVEDLKSGEAAVEARARSELGMIKPGETFYRVVEPQQAPPPRPQADDGNDPPQPRPEPVP
ncbi:MAG TPA: cell division protein FtsB [Xanthomonadaceae bacterium]|nr:cell division protein FtsB [Xanthomonadaceae bacterium]